MDFKTKKKLELIEDILKILYPNHVISELILENPKKVSYSVSSNYSDHLSGWKHRFEIYWNNDLDFEIWRKRENRVSEQHFKTSAWFEVQDLLKKRYLDCEKLKV